jgi:hypothetical protein
MRIIVAGSRTVNDYNIVKNILDHVSSKIKIDVIISGDAKGPDSYGTRWAEEHDIPVEHFPPDWHTYGRTAGVMRNIEMSNVADALIAIWDGQSRGTKHMISRMRELSKLVYIKEL